MLAKSSKWQFDIVDLLFVYPQGPAQLGINFDEGKTVKNQYYELLNGLILSHITSCANLFLAFFGS